MIFSAINAKDAERFIGKPGFFGYSLKNLEEARKNRDFSVLSDVSENNPVETVFKSGFCRYGLFSPLEMKEISKLTFEEVKNLSVGREYSLSDGVQVYNGVLLEVSRSLPSTITSIKFSKPAKYLVKF